MEKRGVVVGAGAALLLAGLLGGGSAAAEVPGAVGRYSTPESVQTVTPEQSYVVAIRGLIASRPHAEQTDAELIKGGKSLCAEINAGATWQTFSDQIKQYGVDRSLAQSTIYAAVNMLCPENAGILR